MIHMSFVILIFSFCALSCDAQISYPQVSFEYNWKSKCIDCIGSVFGNSITAQHMKQLTQLLPGLRAAWKNSAPELFRELFSCFKCGFKQSKRTATIYLSHNASYGSHRFLILGLWYYRVESNN